MFNNEYWLATAYGECEEEVSSNAPVARGLWVYMRVCMGLDHAGDRATRRSRVEFLIVLNGAPIFWYSKEQISIETSSFGAEFITMKQCCEYIRGLRHKLRMMGIPIDLPTYVFGKNQSVLTNRTFPHSKLRKKFKHCLPFCERRSSKI